ncbi:hypothetical protein NU219Hw_g7332t1, partial [Hortaea werneckii]
ISSTHLTSSHENTLLCITCNTNLGNFDTNTHSHRLGKQSLCISATATSTPKSHATELWLSCHLLTSADTQGVRKFKVYRHHDGTAEEPPRQSPTVPNALQIWLFATDLVISSSTSPIPGPLPVLKILYKRVDVPPAEASTGRLDAQALSEGELELPRQEWEFLDELLRGSAVLLPSRARAFQDWEVGVLRRFTRDAVEGG